MARKKAKQEFLTGQTLSGRYRLESLLGTGGMGEVYLALDSRKEDRRVAVKLLKDQITVDWFKQEFETLSLMVHPNIAQVFDFDHDRERGVYFYTCEFVEGRPADEALAGASFEAKLDCYVQILRALQYIHGQGYLHCDMKPKNVLVVSDGAGRYLAKVLDFGLAMAFPRSAMTARGTFSYMAPEWFEGGVPGAYTDIYSTGIMLYEITYGQLPFVPSDSGSCVEFHTRGELTFPADVNDAPDWWAKVLLRMTTKDIADRLVSVDACLSALNRLGTMDLVLHETGYGAPEAGIGGPWLGRSHQLSTALELIHSAFQGNHERGAHLIVRGEDGVGKSRMLAELKRRMQLEGAAVIALTASGGSSTFGTLVSAVRGLSGAVEPELAQERISHVVTRLVSQAIAYARNHPLLVLVDDLPMVDEHVLGFLSGLLNAADFSASSDEESVRVAIVATSSESGLPESLAANPLSREVSLEQLNRGQTGRLLRLILGLADVPDELVEEAWAACKGNPKLLHELALFLRESGCLAITPTGVVFYRDRLPTGGLPSSVEQYLQQAWNNFGDDERSLLTTMALLFGPQPFHILAEIAGHEVWHIDQLVAELARRGLVAFSAVSDRELPTIESETMRQMFLANVKKAELKELHKRIASALAAVPRLGDEHRASLAYHLYHAGRKKDALAPALAGAAYEIENCNFRNALQLVDIASATGAQLLDIATLYFKAFMLWGRYEEGIEALTLTLDKAGDASQREQITLYLCELYFRSGNYEPACRLVEPLAESENESVVGQALALLARIFFYLGKHKESRDTGERGMLVLSPDSREFALCAAMVGLVRVYGGKLQQGAKYLETALGILESKGSASDVAFAANGVALAHHKLKDYVSAEEHYRKSLEVASEAGDHERINVASMNLSVVCQETGEYGQAISRYKTALAMAYQSQNLPVLARVYNNLGNIHRYLGMLQKARDFTERSIELADRLNLELSKGLNRMLMGEILALQGRFDDAQALYEQADQIFVAVKASDERLECDIDRLELLCLAAKWDEACALGKAAVTESGKLKLDNHRLRALLGLSLAMLKRNRAEDPGKAIASLDEAAELVGEVGNPELEFKLWGLRTQAHGALGDAEKAALALRRAENSLAMLKQKIPEEFQSVFFKRADRKKMLADFSKISSKMAQLAQTISPMTPAAGGLHLRQRWIRELIRMNERLLAQHDLERLLETLIDVVVDLSGAERGFVLLASGDGLDVTVARNMDREAIRRSRTKFSTSIARKVLETGDVIRLEDAIEADDFRTKKSVMALRIRSVICLPVGGRDRTIGAIYLDNRFKPGVFSESVIEMLNAFSEQAAIAIENARLLIKYRATVEELERSQQEVERLNKRLQEKVEFQEMVIEQKSEEIDRKQAQLEERYQFTNIVGRSAALQRLFAVMQRVKETHVPVLITGDSGAGKELVARALHFSGLRKRQRFVSINCAALPDTLLESELFGYQEGAFTDARKSKKGLFSLADNGTLFLDEVGDMSLTMQAKLLRVLQEGELSPLGSEETLKVDVRIVAATNRDLKVMVQQGSFRQDLYYRLDVVSIKVPSLRERKEDVPLLIDHFLTAYATKNKLPKPRVSMQALQILMAYDWPGNVRELQSVVTTSAVFAENNLIVLESLRTKPEVFGERRLSAESLPALDTLNLKELEKRAIVAALVKTEGNKQQTSKVLGISRRALYNKLEAYKIDTDKLL